MTDELCAACNKPITRLRVVVPMFGQTFGPYCSMECAPEPAPRTRAEPGQANWPATVEVQRLVGEYGLAGVMGTLVHLYDELSVRAALDSCTRGVTPDGEPASP